ncbi:MAG: tetratricopeptide repeat protein [Rikenellaceae bacterium]
MKVFRLIFAAVAALLLLFVSVAEGAVGDRVSEAGEKLRIRPSVRRAIDGVVAEELKQDLKRARELYQAAIRSDSTYAPARYALANLMLGEGADSAAIHARKAYLSDTMNRWYLETYAQSLIATDRYEEAVRSYERLIKLSPHDLNAYRILAILYNRGKQSERALAILDTAELKAGRHSYLASLKRQILISTNQIGRAVVETEAAIKENPYSADNRVAMAELYAMARVDSLAAKHYATAMRIDSARLETLLSYGNFLEQRGKEAEYLNILRLVMQNQEIELKNKISLVSELITNQELYRREYLKIGDLIRSLLLQSPKNKQLVELQSRHLIMMGMVEEAARYMKTHLNDVPAELEYYRSVISMERYLERPDSVDLYLVMAASRFPEESSLRYERAYMLTSQKRYSEAIECYKAEMATASDSLRSFNLGTIGDVYHQMASESSAEGDEKLAAKLRRESYKYYDKALKVDRDNILVLNNYAYFLSENGGDLKKAYEMSKRSTELEASNPTYLDTYAWILYRLHRYAESKVVMRQAISFDRSENGEIALHYGEILSVLGEQTMANFYWDKALAWGMSEEDVRRSRERAVEMATVADRSVEQMEVK